MNETQESKVAPQSIRSRINRAVDAYNTMVAGAVMFCGVTLGIQYCLRRAEPQVQGAQVVSEKYWHTVRERVLVRDDMPGLSYEDGGGNYVAFVDSQDLFERVKLDMDYVAVTRRYCSSELRKMDADGNKVITRAEQRAYHGLGEE